MIKHFSRAALLLALLFISTGAYCQDTAHNTLTKKEKRKGWVLLFDGATTAGWTKTNGAPFPAAGWVIRNGELTIDTTAKGGDIITTGEYSDFELTIDFKVGPTCNSGIKYFFTRYATGGLLGMEYQVMDDVCAADNKQANHLCGALYDIFAADEKAKKAAPLGDWNTARIVSKGKQVEHWLNGKKILEFSRDSAPFLAAVEKSKYKTTPVFGSIDKGHILLQEHGHTASFRNIKIREL